MCIRELCTVVYNSLLYTTHIVYNSRNTPRARLAHSLISEQRTGVHMHTHTEKKRERGLASFMQRSHAALQHSPSFPSGTGSRTKDGGQKGRPFPPRYLLPGFRLGNNHHQHDNPVGFRATSRNLDHRSSRLLTRSKIMKERKNNEQ